MPDVLIQVYDRPMCCSTGVCGPDVDDALVRFAADLEWLRTRGISVRRFNPAQEPNAFVSNRTVRRLLQEQGSGCLPIVIMGEDIMASGAYPDRGELLSAAGLTASGGAS